MTDPGGKVDGRSGDAEFRRLERAYRALCLAHRHIVRAGSERELFESVCKTLVEAKGYPLAWVGVPDNHSPVVRPVAGAGVGDAQDYLDRIRVGSSDDELGRGPTGTAIRTGRPSVNNDSETNPDFRPWREQALRYGFRASIALPLRSGGKTFGALTVYASEPNAFDAEERSLLEGLADDVGFALAALRSRKALELVEARLRELDEARTKFAILDDAPNGFMAIDHEWRYLYVNEVGARLSGHTPESLIGRVIWDVFPQAVGTGFHAAYHRAMEAGEVVALEEHYAPLGLWFDVRVYPIEAGIAVHFSDISRRKRLELSLRDSEERFRQLAENIDDVFWLTDPDRAQVLYVSPAYQKIWGRSSESLHASLASWLAAVHAEDRGRIEQSLPRQASGGWDELYRIVRPDGSVRWIRDRAYPVRDASGHVYRVAGVARDITEHRRLEEQFRQAQKMEAVGQLAGGVAHDFNNVLTVILSYADMILSDLEPNAPFRADLEEIRKAGLRAADLTKQLLAFSRQQVLQTRMLDLNESVAGVEKILRRLVGADIALTMLTAEGLWSVKADPGQIDQILMNLAVNARDAMPTGGTLTIASANVELDADAARIDDVRAGSYVMLAVTDTGVGIDKETQPRIFEPFFTTKEHGRGTGLGLAMVFAIVEQSGGHVRVESEPGKGSTFRLYFPRASGNAEVRTWERPVPDSVRGSETILLVEDDDQVRALAGTILRRQGYVVLEAPNGGEALLICEQHGAKIHLLVTDVVLPRMSGWQLAERLASLRPEMKVLFMSGYTGDAALQHGAVASGDVFLQKPLTPGSLTRKVREVLLASDSVVTVG